MRYFFRILSGVRFAKRATLTALRNLRIIAEEKCENSNMRKISPHALSIAIPHAQVVSSHNMEKRSWYKGSTAFTKNPRAGNFFSFFFYEMPKSRSRPCRRRIPCERHKRSRSARWAPRGEREQPRPGQGGTSLKIALRSSTTAPMSRSYKLIQDKYWVIIEQTVDELLSEIQNALLS